MVEAPTRIAVLGTGLLGAPIAANLSRCGFDVVVWNRTLEKASHLAEHGCSVHMRAQDAVADADAVITVLADAAATEEVLGDGGVLAAMRPGTLLIQTGTVGVEAIERIGRLAAEHDVLFVDAPVSGSSVPAEHGELVILAGGDDAARAAAEPVFAAMGRRTHWVGEVGAGTRLKLVINAWLACLMEALAETIAMAETAGIDARHFLDAIAGGPLDVPYAQLKGAAMIQRAFDPAFVLRLLPKDAGLARGLLGDQASTVAPMLDLVIERAAEAVALGHGERDVAAIFYASGRP